jgi:hypothetical protein
LSVILMVPMFHIQNLILSTLKHQVTNICLRKKLINTCFLPPPILPNWRGIGWNCWTLHRTWRLARFGNNL